jgi:hypothetical protein
MVVLDALLGVLLTAVLAAHSRGGEHPRAIDGQQIGVVEM